MTFVIVLGVGTVRMCFVLCTGSFCRCGVCVQVLCTGAVYRCCVLCTGAVCVGGGCWLEYRCSVMVGWAEGVCGVKLWRC